MIIKEIKATADVALELEVEKNGMSNEIVKVGNNGSEPNPSARCEGLLWGRGVTRLNTQEAGELPFTHSSDPGQMNEVYLLLEFPEKFKLRTSRLLSAGFLSFSRNASESLKGSRRTWRTRRKEGQVTPATGPMIEQGVSPLCLNARSPRDDKQH